MTTSNGLPPFHPKLKCSRKVVGQEDTFPTQIEMISNKRHRVRQMTHATRKRDINVPSPNKWSPIILGKSITPTSVKIVSKLSSYIFQREIVVWRQSWSRLRNNLYRKCNRKIIQGSANQLRCKLSSQKVWT